MKPKPDYRIAFLSAMGLLGFIAGCIFLFYDTLGFSRRPVSIFHEISYAPTQCTYSCIKDTITSLDNIIKTANKTIGAFPAIMNEADKKRKDMLIEQKKRDSFMLLKLYAYKQYYEDQPLIDSMGFTVLNKALHFVITPDSIHQWDSAFSKKDTAVWKSPWVKYYLKDKDIPFKIHDSTKFTIIPAQSDIAFITRYPQAGVWLLLILVFCSFCFLAISTAWHLAGKVRALFPGAGLSKYTYGIICFITALVIALAIWIWKCTFYDVEIIKDIFFLQHLRTSMNLVKILGCIAGACCLAGFIYTASMLSYFSEPLSKIRKRVAEKRQAVKNAAPEALPKAQAALEETEQEDAETEKLFTRLSNIFQTYFMLAAIILSLLILCTGALFNTVNSLDFVKLLADDWGYSPARADFIYLYGGLYTIILLLVYVPARIRFGEVDMPGNAVLAENKKWYEILKNPFGNMKGLLVASSPLLVSVIQSLIETLFQ
jgi:hypothetical protein